MQRLFTFFILFLLAHSSFAQNSASISGKVLDNNGQPLSYATVTLLKTDSSVAGGDLTKDDGAFSISASAGKFLLRIESIGFEVKFVSANVTESKPTLKLGSIKLTSSSQTLGAVNITAEKRVMELKVDKKVFNVEKNTTTAGGSATDVLQNVPAVSVDLDGNVNLRGKSNVTVLIDGKPATLLGSDVTSALQSLSASSIESVEVITNPSARYDAQGTTGIINIILKKDRKLGVNGNVTLGAGTRDKYNGNASLNIRKGKWNVFINSSGRQYHTFNNVTTTRADLIPTGSYNRSYHTYEHVPRMFNGTFNTIGATYDFDKNNSLTLTQNINAMQWGYRDWSDYYIYSMPEQSGETLLHRYRYSEALGGPVSSSSSFDYKHKFKKKGEELNVDATYSANHMRRSQNYITRTDTGNITGINTISQAPGSGGNSSTNVWADFVTPLFTENGKFGAGFKSQFYSFNSSNDPYIWEEGSATKSRDSSLFSTYNYNQQIHAVYINWNDQQGKIGYQLGLRGELAEYDGSGNVPTYAKFHNRFLNLFPSAFVTYQLTSTQSVYVNYSRRTNRPGFFDMMPFKDFSNPGNITMGNPNILPEFIHNVELSYSFNSDNGNTLIFSSYFARTSNFRERVQRPITGSAEDTSLGLQNEVGNLVTIPVNIASGTTFGLEGTARAQITKAWDATVSANFFNNQLTIGSAAADYAAYLTNMNGYGWFSKLNSNLKLPKDFSFQLTGNYESPKIIAQGKQRQSYWIDLAVKKNLWKNKATLVVNCSDVFKTRRFISDFTTSTYSQTINRVKETRIGNLTFTYRFGKQQDGSGKMGDKQKSRKAEKSKVAVPGDQDRLENLKQRDDDGGGGSGGSQKSK